MKVTTLRLVHYDLRRQNITWHCVWALSVLNEVEHTQPSSRCVPAYTTGINTKFKAKLHISDAEAYVCMLNAQGSQGGAVRQKWKHCHFMVTTTLCDQRLHCKLKHPQGNLLQPAVYLTGMNAQGGWGQKDRPWRSTCCQEPETAAAQHCKSHSIANCRWKGAQWSHE